MKCPHCGTEEDGVLYLCRRCWFKVPAKLRIELSRMHHNRQNTTSKFDKVKRWLKEHDLSLGNKES